jgi:hypothetical protein
MLRLACLQCGGVVRMGFWGVGEGRVGEVYVGLVGSGQCWVRGGL